VQRWFATGLYDVGGTPTIFNCLFTHNATMLGQAGAIWNEDGAPTIEGCSFVENLSLGGDGGAIFETGTGAARILGGNRLVDRLHGR